MEEKRRNGRRIIFALANRNCTGAKGTKNKGISLHNKPAALVTGANQGIGLQIAKDLVARGLTALVGSRNLGRGEAVTKEIGPDARAVQLEVANKDSIATAAERIRKEQKLRPVRSRTSCGI